MRFLYLHRRFLYSLPQAGIAGRHGNKGKGEERTNHHLKDRYIVWLSARDKRLRFELRTGDTKIE